jgi:hypothetical protein
MLDLFFCAMAMAVGFVSVGMKATHYTVNLP